MYSAESMANKTLRVKVGAGGWMAVREGWRMSIKIGDLYSFKMYFLLEFREGFFEEGMMGKLRIFLDKIGGFLACDLDEADVREVFHGDIGESGLACSEKASRTAEFEILFRDIETARVPCESL